MTEIFFMIILYLCGLIVFLTIFDCDCKIILLLSVVLLIGEYYLFYLYFLKGSKNDDNEDN